MSSSAVAEFIERALNDSRFQDTLMADPEAAMNEYDLSLEEQNAVMDGCKDVFESLELDKRLSKYGFF